MLTNKNGYRVGLALEMLPTSPQTARMSQYEGKYMIDDPLDGPEGFALRGDDIDALLTEASLEDSE